MPAWPSPDSLIPIQTKRRPPRPMISGLGGRRPLFKRSLCRPGLAWAQPELGRGRTGVFYICLKGCELRGVEARAQAGDELYAGFHPALVLTGQPVHPDDPCREHLPAVGE